MKLTTLFVAPLLLCGTSRAQDAPPSVEVNIRAGLLEEIEAARPPEVMLHEILPSDPERWLKTFVEATEIDGKLSETEDLIHTREGDRYLEVRRVSSATFYGDLSRLWRQGPTPESPDADVASDARTRELALAWLASFRFGEAELRELEIAVSDEAFELTLPRNLDEVIRVVVGKNVEVRRRIDGLLVYGPGSKIKLSFGEGGRLDGYTVVWRQVLPGSRVLGHTPTEGSPRGAAVRPITAREAYDRFQGNPLDHLTLAPVDRIDIERVDFGYYSRSATEPQRYLQPIYVFTGTATTLLPDGRTTRLPFEQVVVALDEPVESIWPDTRVFNSDPGPKKPSGRKDKDEKGG